MIFKVVVSAHAAKTLNKVPARIRNKLYLWKLAVEEVGLEQVRKIPGYHDEPLQGNRQGQRSIRLSRAYRAVYIILDDSSVKCVSVEEVSKHGY